MKWVKIPIYNVYIYFYVYDETKVLVDISRHVKDVVDKLIEPASDGFMLEYSNKNISVGFNENILEDKNRLAGVIAHEALHCVFNIMESRNLYIDYKNNANEHLTYLLEYIVTEAHKYIDYYKK